MSLASDVFYIKLVESDTPPDVKKEQRISIKNSSNLELYHVNVYSSESDPNKLIICFGPTFAQELFTRFLVDFRPSSKGCWSGMEHVWNLLEQDIEGYIFKHIMNKASTYNSSSTQSKTEFLKTIQVVMTGILFGGALATVAASHMCRKLKHISCSLITFDSPRCIVDKSRAKQLLTRHSALWEHSHICDQRNYIINKNINCKVVHTLSDIFDGIPTAPWSSKYEPYQSKHINAVVF